MLSFFIPFAIALITGWIAYESQEEIVKTFFVIVMAISLLNRLSIGNGSHDIAPVRL